jgi:hypothetical protein
MARPDDEIVLQAGAIYTETIALPDKGAGRTDHHPQLGDTAGAPRRSG